MSKEQKKEDFGNFLKTYYSILKIKAGKNFNLTDKMVLLVILSLDDPKKHCYAKNKYISKILGLSEVTISTSIGKLCEDLGLVTREGNRQARVLIPISPKELIKRLDEVSRKVIKELNEVHQGTIPTSSKNLMNSSKGLMNSLKTLDILNKNKINDEINILDNNKKDDLLSETESDVDSSQSNKLSSSSKVTKNKDKLYATDSFAYITSEYLLELVLKNYPNFDYRLQDQKYRERKLQNSAKEIDLMVRVDKRPENEIIEVIEWASQDSFWKQNIKSGSKLRKQYGELLIRMEAQGSKTLSRKQEEKLLNDPIPELTRKFIRAHRSFAGRGWEPTIREHNKFIRATIMAEKKVRNIGKDWVQVRLVEEIIEVLNFRYYSKGEAVCPGHYCSDFTWDTLLPQFILSTGVNIENLFNYQKDGVDLLDKFAAEEEQLTRQIDKNIGKDKLEPKQVNVDTDETFGYITSV